MEGGNFNRTGKDKDSRKRIKLDVEMYGDTVCPWCYIAKKNIDSAIESYAAKYPEDVFDVVWKPFILWPNIKRSAYDKRAPLFKMFGPSRAPGVFARLEASGAEQGIHFNWEGRAGNSIDSNKLIMLAYEKDLKLRASQQEQVNFPQSPTSTPPRRPPSPGSTVSKTPSCGLHPMDIDPTTTGDSPAVTTSSPPPPLSTTTTSTTTTTITSPQPKRPPPTHNHLPILNPHQHYLLDALFFHFFTQSLDSSDRASLLSLALSLSSSSSSSPYPIAFSADEIVSWLDGPESAAKLARVAAETRAAAGGGGGGGGGIGVPTVVVQGRYRVGGCQKVDVYLGVFERVRAGLVGVDERDEDGGGEGRVGCDDDDGGGGGGRLVGDRTGEEAVDGRRQKGAGCC